MIETADEYRTTCRNCSTGIFRFKTGKGIWYHSKTGRTECPGTTKGHTAKPKMQRTLTA